MKNYYYCEANFAIYTESEKTNSIWSSGRFFLVGSFRSRREAITAFEKRFPLADVTTLVCYR